MLSGFRSGSRDKAGNPLCALACGARARSARQRIPSFRRNWKGPPLIGYKPERGKSRTRNPARTKRISLRQQGVEHGRAAGRSRLAFQYRLSAIRADRRPDSPPDLGGPPIDGGRSLQRVREPVARGQDRRGHSRRASRPRNLEGANAGSTKSRCSQCASSPISPRSWRLLKSNAPGSLSKRGSPRCSRGSCRSRSSFSFGVC